MARREYQLSLLNYCGGYDFDATYARYILSTHKDSTVNVLIDSRGGQLATALSISAAFADHGDVHVHYTGINASAATIASLGAKHVTIAPDAFYLVHQASLPFFEFRNLNSDQIEEYVKSLEKKKADLLTYDRSISEAYARRCKKSPDDLLALMKEERLLSAKEALDWGFVDQIISYEGDAPLRVSEELVAECSAIGIRLPESLTPKGPVARFFSRLAEIFANNNPHTETSNPTDTMDPTLNTPEATTPATTTPAPAATPAATTPEASLEARIAALEARLNAATPATTPAAEAPQATPGTISVDTPPMQVVTGTRTEPSQTFAQSLKAGAELYKSLP